VGGHDYLLEIGRTAKPFPKSEELLEHDRIALITNADFGLYMEQAGRTDEAIAQFQKTLELDPNYAAAHIALDRPMLRSSNIGNP